jgi:transposase
MACHKKKARRLKAWLVFLDESGFQMAPHVRRSWAPRGQTPVLRQRGRHHKKVSVIAVLCVSPGGDKVKHYFRQYADRNISYRQIIEFLRMIDKELGAPWCLLWDRLNAHRAKKTREYLDSVDRLHTFFLPAYAPELNPVEYLWGYSKINPLANVAVREVTELVEVTRVCGRSIQRKEELLRSFIRHSPLFLRLK